MGREDMNRALGLTEAEMDAIAEEYETDSWDESEFDAPTPGRPPLYGAAMGVIAIREPAEKIDEINARARDLGLSRSAYIRSLIDKDLLETA